MKTVKIPECFFEENLFSHAFPFVSLLIDISPPFDTLSPVNETFDSKLAPPSQVTQLSTQREWGERERGERERERGGREGRERKRGERETERDRERGERERRERGRERKRERRKRREDEPIN